MNLKYMLKHWPRLSSRRWLAIGVSCAFLLAIGGAILLGGGASEAAVVESIVVTKRDFDLEALARGTVRPARVVAVKSQISSNQAQLIYLHEEGIPVNTGLVIARFDTKPFMDRMQVVEQEVADVQARVLATQKAIRLLEEDYSGKLETSNRNLEIARIKAQDLREGSGKLKRQQLRQKLEQDKRAHQLAKSELEDFDFLLGKGHVSQRERDKTADRLRSLEESLRLTEAELANFEQYEFPRTLREAELLVEGAKTDTERLRRTATIERQRIEAEQERHRRDLAVVERRLEEAMRDVANCDVSAPIDGVLLHTELPKPEGKRKIQIGDAIWFGQTFLEMPDTRELVIDLDVREVDVARLKPGMPAMIELDALPGRHFKGALTSISNLAVDDRPGAPIRNFRVQVKIADPGPELHIGLSANVRIVHRSLKKVLAIPVSAIAYREGTPVVEMEGDVVRRVRLGAVGANWAEVIDGLKDGEHILIRKSL